jgi:hypothetical protein
MDSDPTSVLIPAEVLSAHEQSIDLVVRSHQSEYDGLDDPRYGQALRYYAAFTHNPSAIDPELSPLSIFYNRYYWFQKFKSLYTQYHGYSAGLEQQAFKILEYAHEHSNLDIDLLLIDAIDKLFE